MEGTKTQQGIFIFRLVTNKQNIDVNRHVLRYGQDFSAAGKQAKVVVQRHPVHLDNLLVLDLVQVEHHRNGVVLGQGVALPSF